MKQRHKYQKKEDRRAFKAAEKKKQKTYYYILIGFMIAYVAYYLEAPKTIGSNPKYIYYIVIAPTVIGVIILAWFRRNFLEFQWITNNEIPLRIFMIFFYLLQSILFSYLSLGLAASITWDFINYQKAQQNPVITHNYPITKLGTSYNSSYIDFIFNDSEERIETTYRNIKNLDKEYPKKYQLQLTTRKGIWGYYVVAGYMIVE